MDAKTWKDLLVKNKSKIVFLIMDGLGGLPLPGGDKTELETARTPNFDQFVREGIGGLLDPIYPGFTPGSGPAHLALFGYDPVENNIGRGVLSALGVDFELTDRDVAARLNFCTLDDQGRVSDRRAGRISTDLNQKLCEKIRKQVQLSGDVEYFIRTESEHRAVLILRGDGLGGKMNDTDPQQTGVAPLEPHGEDEASEKTARVVKEFLAKVKEVLRSEHPANYILARGFAKLDPLPTMEERYGLRSVAIAQYPMYRGLARLVGMTVPPVPQTFEDMWEQLQAHYSDYDFFFIHFKKTDSYGEDGNFEAKVKMIETVDEWAGKLRGLNPDVLVVTGDHSTPSVLKSHSWHPVPVLLWSKYVRPDGVAHFGERDCAQGYIGRMPMRNIILIAMANALRFTKFGA
ncbi:MAG: 2,3-bisphosphoglycerate-independent phosphoglycerate mutase [Calditrichia bacterium]